jgi:hypothetical protein
MPLSNPNTFLTLTDASPTITVPDGGAFDIIGSGGTGHTINVDTGGSIDLSNPGTGTVININGNSSDYDIVADGSEVQLIGPNGEQIFLSVETTAQQIVFLDGAADLVLDLSDPNNPFIDFGGQTVTETQADVMATLDPNETSEDEFPQPLVPTFDVSDDGPVEEGDTATFTISLDNAPSGESFSVDYAVGLEGGASADDHGDITVDGAVDNSGSGTLSFAPGETSKTITIPVLEDLETPETGEGISVTLSNATGTDAVLGDDTTTADITDVFPFMLTPEDGDVQEGDSITYTLTTLVPVDGDTDVDFTVVPGDVTAPDQGSNDTNLNDFDQGSFNPTTVTIPDGGTTATFTLDTTGDGLTELPEDFTVEAVINGETVSVETTLLDGDEGQTFTLTTGIDNIQGGDDDDLILGVNEDDDSDPLIDTFNPGDNIDGGDGEDTLQIRVLDEESAFGDGFGAGATVNDVEILEVFEAASDGAEFDLVGFTGLEQIVLDTRYSDSYSFYNLGEELISITMEGTRAPADSRGFTFYLFDVANNLYTADDDELTINVKNAGSEEEDTSAYFSHYSAPDFEDVFEMYKVVVSGDDNYLWIENDNTTDVVEVTKLTVMNAPGESGSLKLELDEEEELETVDASGMAGAFTYFFSGTDDEQEIEVTTGTGNDNIGLDDGTYTVDLEDGDDRLQLLKYEDDDDDTDDVLDGGDGTDTLAADVDFWADADFDDLDQTSFEVAEFSGSASAPATVSIDGFDSLVISVNVTTVGGVTVNDVAGKMVTFTENSQSTNALTFGSTTTTDTLDILFAEEASGTVDDLSVADIEDVSLETSSEDDDLTFTTIDISGVESLSVTGEGDVTVNGVTDDGSLATLDLSGMEGVFTNDGAGFDVTDLEDVLIGNVGDGTEVEFVSDYLETVTFGDTLENMVTLDQVGVGVGGVVLDLSALGVDGFADLDVAFDEGTIAGTGDGDEFFTLTSDAYDGSIVLVGTYNAGGDLDGAANFIFA